MYTQDNCDLECHTNFTLDRCDCVKFTMPRNESTPVCGPADFQCTELSDTIFFKNFLKDCNCLPSCTTIEYDTKRSYNVVEDDSNM